MKAKVLVQFYDTTAKVVRKKGDIFDVTPIRFNEISHKGRFIEAYVAPAKAATGAKKEKK